VLRHVTAVVVGLTLGIGLVGTGASVAFAKDVTLTVDGVPQTVTLLSGSVAEALVGAGVTLGPYDQVTPDLATPVEVGTVITVEHARRVVLNIDGRVGDYWTTATTVGELIDELGLDSDIRLSIPTETAIGRDGLWLGIDTGKDVTITAGGETYTVHSGGTVADALRAAGLTWDEDDLVTPATTDWLSRDLAISLVKVEVVEAPREVEIPFESTSQDDGDLLVGQTKVVTEGVPGVKTEVVRTTYHDGQAIEEIVLRSETTREPVTEVKANGTKPLPVNVEPGSAKAIAYEKLKARGWDDTQFQCLVNLWNRESMWRWNATNPSSGAYGIPQALPASKMASAGADWQTNPATQIEWGLGYIKQRYGTPCAAWAHSESSGWY